MPMPTFRNSLVVTLPLLLLVLGLLYAASADERVEKLESPVAVGAELPDVVSLRDMMGNSRPLRDFGGNQALVLAFVGTRCPLSNLYLPRLLRMEQQFREQKVQFLAVYPTLSDTLDDAAAHAYDRDVPFPVLKDFGLELADALGIERVPTVCVLDGEFRLRYRGRIDDQYAVSARRQKASRPDLLLAIEQVVAGTEVEVAETRADGCLLDRSRPRDAEAGATYASDVASILQNRCQKCHRPGMAAPFELMTYQDAVDNAEMIKEVVLQRRMPPWHADARYGHFANDRRMAQSEIDAVVSWIDGGMPMGDSADLPKPVEWVEGWTIGKPDVVIQMPEEYDVAAEGVLPYQYFLVDPDFTEDRWVRAAEARPGADARNVVHHIIVYMSPSHKLDDAFDLDGNVAILVGWAPGDLPLVCPPGTALRIPKGVKLIFELHYTPNGTPATDRSDIGIVFADEPPEREFHVNGFGNTFIRIPPQAPHHREVATFTFPEAARIMGFMPHMHWRGKAYHYEAHYPDGRQEVLLSVPRYDFNWQTYYWFDSPIRVPQGTKIRSVAHWDNSRNNMYNPDPSDEVRFGLQTSDEMMLGWMNYVWERPGAGSEVLTNATGDPAGIFDQVDRNGDERISRDELGDEMAEAMKELEIDTSEPLPRETFEEFLRAMRKARSERLRDLDEDPAELE